MENNEKTPTERLGLLVQVWDAELATAPATSIHVPDEVGATIQSEMIHGLVSSAIECARGALQLQGSGGHSAILPLACSAIENCAAAVFISQSTTNALGFYAGSLRSLRERRVDLLAAPRYAREELESDILAIDEMLMELEPITPIQLDIKECLRETIEYELSEAIVDAFNHAVELSTPTSELPSIYNSGHRGRLEILANAGRMPEHDVDTLLLAVIASLIAGMKPWASIRSRSLLMELASI